MIGVIDKARDTGHAQVAWPEEPDDRMESKGWRPSYEGEEPPF